MQEKPWSSCRWIESSRWSSCSERSLSARCLNGWLLRCMAASRITQSPRLSCCVRLQLENRIHGLGSKRPLAALCTNGRYGISSDPLRFRWTCTERTLRTLAAAANAIAESAIPRLPPQHPAFGGATISSIPVIQQGSWEANLIPPFAAAEINHLVPGIVETKTFVAHCFGAARRTRNWTKVQACESKPNPGRGTPGG